MATLGKHILASCSEDCYSPGTRGRRTSSTSVAIPGVTSTDTLLICSLVWFLSYWVAHIYSFLGLAVQAEKGPVNLTGIL